MTVISVTAHEAASSPGLDDYDGDLGKRAPGTTL
jgi:hypothetical protein